jgi:hypothetical protein
MVEFRIISQEACGAETIMSRVVPSPHNKSGPLRNNIYGHVPTVPSCPELKRTESKYAQRERELIQVLKSRMHAIICLFLLVQPVESPNEHYPE